MSSARPSLRGGRLEPGGLDTSHFTSTTMPRIKRIQNRPMCSTPSPIHPQPIPSNPFHIIELPFLVADPAVLVLAFVARFHLVLPACVVAFRPRGGTVRKGRVVPWPGVLLSAILS